MVLGWRAMLTRLDLCLTRALEDQACWRTCQRLRAVEEHGTWAEGWELATEFLRAEKVSEGEEAAKVLFHQRVYGMVVERGEGLVGSSLLFLCSQGLFLRVVLQEAVEVEGL